MSEPGSPNRHAILVDAGYLYAAGGLLVVGTTSRAGFRVAAEQLVQALIGRAAETTPGDLLRVYWYDAARDRVPTVEQRQIAVLPNVKVRLGNVNGAGQQKGVDAQIRQDMELLALRRAVSDVVLVAGDEDMLSAVESAQGYGVRVHVWGVEPPYGVNQAERLVWEADTVDQLDGDFCRPYFTRPAAALPPPGALARPVAQSRPPAAPAPSPARPAPPAPARPAVVPGPRPGPPPRAPLTASIGGAAAQLGPDRRTMEEIGEHVAGKWLVTRGRDNLADLLPGPPLPPVIDLELLVEAEQHLNRSLRPFEDARRALRDGFWARLHREFGTDAGTPRPPA